MNKRQRSRPPRLDLRAVERFEADFGIEFGFALAHSAFTHVSRAGQRMVGHTCRIGPVP